MFDIEQCPVVDAHSHALPLDIVSTRDPAGLIDRCTITGMCIQSSQFATRIPQSFVGSLTASTPFARRLIREMAKFLDCEADLTSVITARTERLQTFGVQYFRDLMKDANLSALIVDEGYPQPAVHASVLEREYNLPVGRVIRIEPLILGCLEDSEDWPSLCSRFMKKLADGIADGAVAIKSIIAYRAGLDISWPNASELENDFNKWQRAGFPNGRGPGKNIRDALMYLTADAAKEAHLPIHIHCGGGDADVFLEESRPAKLFSFLKDRFDQDIVLIHSGWPWTEEAAFISSVLPNVYLETSLATPWASLAIENKLKSLLGIAPPFKILYGSDASSEPEILWFSAKVMRHSLQRVFADAVSEGWLIQTDIMELASGILSGNARRLHRLA